MATKPTSRPRWARTAAGVDATNITTPSSGEQDTGWTVGQTPIPSGKTNFLMNLIDKWVAYLQDAIFVADAGSVKAGIDATGDGATPGGKFTPGGAGTPARGAVALATQTTPTAPSNGDVWYDGTNLVCRVNGVTIPLTNVRPFASLRFATQDGDVAVGLTVGGVTTKFNSFTAGKALTGGTRFTNDTVGKITILDAGTYRVSWEIFAQDSTSAISYDLTVFIEKNGASISAVESSGTAMAGRAGSMPLSGTFVRAFAANDFLELFYNIIVSAGTVSMFDASLIVERIA